MTKNVLFITMKRCYFKKEGRTDLEMNTQCKEAHQTKNGTYYYSSNRQLPYAGQPFIYFTFPSGKVCAYSIDMSKEDTINAILKEIERPIKNKICMYLRKRDSSISYKAKYNELLNDAMTEYESCKSAIAKFKAENNLS